MPRHRRRRDKDLRPFLDGNEPFLVHNADILSDINLAELYR